MKSKETEIVSRFPEMVKEERLSCRSCLSFTLVNDSHYTEFLLSRTSQELQAPKTICFVISKKEASQRLRGRDFKCCQMERERRERMEKAGAEGLGGGVSLV